MKSYVGQIKEAKKIDDHTVEAHQPTLSPSYRAVHPVAHDEQEVKETNQATPPGGLAQGHGETPLPR